MVLSPKQKTLLINILAKYKKDILFNDEFSNLYNWTIIEKLGKHLAFTIKNFNDTNISFIEEKFLEKILNRRTTVNAIFFYELTFFICNKEIVSIEKLKNLYKQRNILAHNGYDKRNMETSENFEYHYEYELLFTNLRGGINEK